MFQFQVIDPASLKSSGSNGNAGGVDATDNARAGKIGNETENLNYKVGDRVICDGFAGSVMYVGPVEPHPGLWLGVEWDDPSRGKHDGTVNGKQYFKSDKSEAGSFVRCHKVKKCKTITEAINERYGYDVDKITTLEDIDGGLERRKVRMSKLKILDVRSREIFYTEDAGILAKLCPLLKSLCIASNFIQDWNSIGNLCLGLERLKELDVSENPLEKVSTKLSDNLETVFQKLNVVVLGKVGYEWDDVTKASLMWQNIEDFYVMFNKISSLSPFASPMSRLKNLDLGGNHISSWTEVLKLNSLLNIESINLSGNKITEVCFPKDGEGDSMPATDASQNWFPKLLRLNLSENRIQSWTSVDEITKLRSLTELRIDTNPFLENDSRANNRQMLVARLPHIQKLDGVDVLKQERRDAELDYVKKFEMDYRKKDPKIFLKEHPRFLELAKVFGLLNESEIAVDTRQMQKSLINVQLITCVNGQVATKKLLLTMTVQKLKMLLQRMYHVPGAQIEIRVESTKNSNITFTLENDFYDLSQYSLENGDKLYVQW